MEDRIRKVLLSQEEIREKVIELSDRISYDYITKDLVIVALLNGSVPFLADLIRKLDMPLEYDFIGARSYKGTESGPEVKLTKELTIDIRGRDVLLVDDILDTGRTLSYVVKYVEGFSPKSLRVCVLLEKAVERVVNVVPEYRGFRIEDYYVVGYGLDYRDQYRNLPYVAVLSPD